MNLIRNTTATLATAWLFAACGGGGTDNAGPTSAASTSPTAMATAPATVQLEGCVLDAREQPLSAPVQALDEDGRLIAQSHSTAEGLFRMQVPARSQLIVGLESPDRARLPVLTGGSHLSLGGCLRDTAA